MRVFRKGDPVVEYTGELHCLGSSARKVAASRREENNFNFYFSSEGTQYW